jgi:Skp family chaperone for outer membrane proteins
MVRTKKYQISEAYNKAFSVLDEKMKKIINKICKKNDIKIVMNGEAVVYMTKDGMDITNMVIEELDKICSNIKVEIGEHK